MTQPTCKTCRWFHIKEPHHIFGDCHRMPPQFEFNVNVQRDRYDQNDKITISRFPHARWPNVEQTEFCGEHTPKGQSNDPQ
jgi:hypothetical protein